ncbi:MBOAT family O-acyltransferase [Microvirga brassicacearum]|uniref:Probable alginate O-acetylase AlgI n=1 Tax=Microvirga brassicacearum TaxID=2580413 RepID=A0A5N3PIY0_9HYPH|nr:MBOAT family protein [Microvirga brassicacearum]KAB0269702.1 MBOAT family protein [Microvirga brassicacearum]
MLFTSPDFLAIYLPVVVVIYFALGGMGWRKPAAAWLAASSLVFYAWDDPTRLLPLIVVSIGFNFLFGTLLSRTRSATVLFLAVAANLTLLGYFKYAMFLLDTLRTFGVPTAEISVKLPIGISFYTFTQIAFLVDAYRGKAREYNPIHYALFVTFFPHLVAGPILHHKEMMPQFQDEKSYRPQWPRVTAGLTWFGIGITKKVLLADNIANFADPVFLAAQQGHTVPFASAWTGAVSYALQLYFDFSGYSDMAIGLALILGIAFPINFFSPYKATSLIEFWRRWHMTLSRFLRDYLYIPLGGNRKGPFRRHVNLFATMVLGGLWHGASWNFVLWGAIHGGALVLNHLWRGTGRNLPVLVARGLTLLVVVLAWVPFRASDFATASSLWRSMVGLNGIEMASAPLDVRIWIAALAGIVLFMPNTAQLLPRPGATDDGFSDERLRHRQPWQPSYTWAVTVGALCGVAIVLAMTTPVAFLYFQF